MIKQRALPNPNNERVEELYEKELLRLKTPGALKNQLTDIDRSGPFRRIYVMGCGRSGTWLLTHVMGTFHETEVVLRELTFEYFGLFATSGSTLILKRDRIAYQRIEQIPECIEIAYILRHPFDVLTSHLPSSNRPYHVLPHRWLGEMMSLQYLLDTGRKNTKVIRYEDLVCTPREVQAELAGYFGLRVGVSIDMLCTTSNNPTESAAHLARTIDIDSIGKYKRDSKKIEYLKTIKSTLGRTLEWVAKTYSYDVSL